MIDSIEEKIIIMGKNGMVKYMRLNKLDRYLLKKNMKLSSLQFTSIFFRGMSNENYLRSRS